MTIINATGSLPGLGRLMVNYVISAGNSTDRSELFDRLLPDNLRIGDNPFLNLNGTLTAVKDAGLLNQSGNTISTTPRVDDFAHGKPLTANRFRRLLQCSIFESIDADPWDQATGETLTSGSKDLTRALSWFLAQDARSTLTWDKTTGGLSSAELLQVQQLPRTTDLRPFSNNARWQLFSRWSVALGMAEPALVGTGLHPDATVAIRDITFEMTPGLRTVDDFLDSLTRQLPVISGGSIRNSFLKLAGSDPDPHASIGLLDTSIAQALLSLEEEKVVTLLPPKSDTTSKTIGLGSVQRRITHLEVHEVAVR
ncbi:protein DpdG [Rhodococcus aetherivorans]|uniref:protein DpdG n=1 Tax=Rhodococcus ruber TaxID=1830 RepID=UPI0024B06655|nr:protein DpdG [Rhodococcus ruber]